MSKTIVGRSDWPTDFTPSPRDGHGDFSVHKINDDFREMFRKGTTHEYELSLYVGPREGIKDGDLARGVYPIKNLDYFECIANRMVEWVKRERARISANTFEIPQRVYANEPDSQENLDQFLKLVVHAIANNKGTDWAAVINHSCGVEWARLPNGQTDPNYPMHESYWRKMYHDCLKGELPPKEVVEAMKRLLTKYGRKWEEPFVLKIDFQLASKKGHSGYNVEWASTSWKKVVDGLLTGDTRLLANGIGGHAIRWDTPLKPDDSGWSGLYWGLSQGTIPLPDYVKEGLTNKALQFIAEGF